MSKLYKKYQSKLNLLEFSIQIISKENKKRFLKDIIISLMLL